MKLRKSYDTEKLVYTMTFEISPTELVAAGGSANWKSQHIGAYVDLIVEVARMQGKTTQQQAFKAKRSHFANILRGNTNQSDWRGFNVPPIHDTGFGAYQTREQMDEAMRQQRAQQQAQARAKESAKPAWALTLGISPSASKDEIKAKYRQLAKDNHPDRGGDAARFARISEAYEQAMK